MATKGVRSSGTQPNRRGIAQGTTLVDPATGFPVCVKEDSSGDYRLCVDANITAQDISVNVDLDGTQDSVSIIDPISEVAIVVNPDGSIDSNVEIDAADGDNIAISSHPDQIFDEAADSLTTTAFEQIYSYTSLDDDTKIIAVDVSVGTPSIIRLKINGAIKRVKRSSPTERDVTFEFREHRSLANGDVLSVEAKVQRLIQTSYDTFTSLEGYLK